jgi:S-adenosylmethionine hydrolase
LIFTFFDLFKIGSGCDTITGEALMAIITLTTDFGLTDGFVGIMKGVIWGICPSAQIADISHGIAPQNVLEGALVLGRSFSFFPAGTIHIAVVDPGVGTSRRPIAARIGDHHFVGPDNGIFTPIYEQAEKNGWQAQIFHLTNTACFLPRVSATFHGRDLFAPVAAHLAKGIPLEDFGPEVNDARRLVLPHPVRTPGGWKAHIIDIDTFGNLATDLPADLLKDKSSVRVSLWGREVLGLSSCYGERNPGELIALSDSFGRLELAVVNGSAAGMTGARLGDELDVMAEK